MSEVKRYTFKGSAGEYVYANEFDRVTAERDALRVALEQSGDLKNELQQRLTAADERADVLEGLLRTSLLAMSRIYEAGRDFIVGTGSDCDSVELMMENDPTAREIRAALKPADTAKCCTVSAEDRALLEAGDYTPEELFGVGGKPSCPKCAKP